MANNFNNRGNGNYRGGYQNKGGNSYEKYAGAPYNFVPFFEKVVPVKPERMTERGKFSEELISGEIDYTVSAQTAIFIDDGTDRHMFMKDEYGRYVIPGSSMRGMIRSNVQILGLSSFDDDIDDYSLMYRTVAGGIKSLRKRYDNILGTAQIPIGQGGETISVLKNVKAGYIVKEKDGNYYIYPAKGGPISHDFGEMNYYVVSEREIQKDMNKFPLFKAHPEYAQHDLKKPFNKVVKNGRVSWEGQDNKSYKPGYYRVSYAISGLRKVVGVADPAQFEKDGFMISTGKMRNKKVHYIIPDIDMDAPAVLIGKEDLRAFRIDFENKKNTLGKNKEFFDLPKNDNPKPVFYIELDGRVYFGFTPRLRLFYDHTVKDGYKQDGSQFDYAQSIFGMTAEKVGYKSRVSFSDALVCGDVTAKGTERVVLAGPKPTSYLDYLEQSGGEVKTYNEDFRLRGVKQYWLHRAEKPEKPTNDNEKVTTVLNPLPKGTEFKGKVRFNTLTRGELGLLLWAMYLQEGAFLNIGKAKPFGYGAIKLNIESVKQFNASRAYAAGPALDISPFEDIDMQEVISDYKKEISAALGKDIDSLESVQTLLLMKSRMPKEEDIRYMIINAPEKEYQSRTKPLPTVKAVLGMEEKGSSFGKNPLKGNDSQSKSAVFTSELAESTPKKSSLKPDKGKEYTATVTEIKAGKLGFRVDLNAARFYGKIKLGKKERDAAASAYPVGSQITVIFNKVNEEDKPIWEVLK